MFTVEEKINHLIKLGFDGNFSEIRKAYSGQKFNPNDENFKKLIEYSDKLCNEFTDLSQEVINTNQSITQQASKRKEEILSILFPGKGLVFGGGDKLRAVIGFVDLEGMNYINKNVNFGKSALCNIKSYVFLASNINFGTDKLNVDENGLSSLNSITINEDTWICSNVNIEDGSNIAKQCVIALGSNVAKTSKFNNSTICFGSPCQSKINITKDYQSKINNLKFERSNEEINYIINVIKSCGIEGNFEEYLKLCKNEKFNALNPIMIKIANYSRQLCSKFNNPSTSLSEKERILDILFPFHGKNLSVGEDLFVDFLGTTKIGDNVKIGKSVVLAGNVEIEDDVVVGNNATLQGMGHEVYYENRRLGKDEHGYPCEISIPGIIKVKKRVIVANGTKIKPNVEVDRNTQPDELYLGK